MTIELAKWQRLLLASASPMASGVCVPACVHAPRMLQPTHRLEYVYSVPSEV